VLDDAGLIVRSPVPGDMRAARLEITPAGEQMHERIRERRTSVLTECLNRLPPQTAAALLDNVPALEALAEAVKPVSR
jgi:DNA-binding MarR family transcriptional regulator